MKGVSRSTVTEALPLMAPTKAPTARATRSPTSPLAPASFIVYAATIPDRATFDPTLRSIPLVMITNVPPTAAIPTTDICTRTLSRLDVVRNLSVARLSTTHSTIRAPNSGPMPLSSDSAQAGRPVR